MNIIYIYLLMLHLLLYGIVGLKMHYYLMWVQFTSPHSLDQ